MFARVFFAITVIALPLASAAAQTPAQVSATSIANSVLISETGQPVSLAAYRGRVVFVNFWGSWCTPCLREMESIRGLQAALTGRSDVVFVFVSARTNSFQADTAWLRANGVAGTNYRWASGSPKIYVPTTFILDQSGNVAQYRSSAVDWTTHVDLIRSLLPTRQASR